MQKILFKYQKWFLRILFAGVGLPIVLSIQLLFAKIMEIEYANFWYICLCTVIMLVWLLAYYAITRRLKLFQRIGAYWVENEIVYIQKGKQTFEIQNIQFLRGTTVSIYGFSKSAMLVIKLEKQKIILVSSSDTPIDSFSDSELFPLFEIISEHNSNLKKDDVIDYLYEIKQ